MRAQKTDVGIRREHEAKWRFFAGTSGECAIVVDEVNKESAEGWLFQTLDAGNARATPRQDPKRVKR